jgi:hypothetical protein
MLSLLYYFYWEYDGSFFQINNDRGRDYTGGNITSATTNQPSLLGTPPLPSSSLYASPSPTNGVQPPASSPNQAYVPLTAGPATAVEQFQYLPPPPGVPSYLTGSQVSPPGVTAQQFPGSQSHGAAPYQFPGSQVLPPGVAPQQFGSQLPAAGVVSQQYPVSSVPEGQQIPFTPQPPQHYNY